MERHERETDRRRRRPDDQGETKQVRAEGAESISTMDGHRFKKRVEPAAKNTRQVQGERVFRVDGQNTGPRFLSVISHIARGYANLIGPRRKLKLQGSPTVRSSTSRGPLTYLKRSCSSSVSADMLLLTTRLGKDGHRDQHRFTYGQG